MGKRNAPLSRQGKLSNDGRTCPSTFSWGAASGAPGTCYWIVAQSAPCHKQKQTEQHEDLKCAAIHKRLLSAVACRNPGMPCSLALSFFGDHAALMGAIPSNHAASFHYRHGDRKGPPNSTQPPSPLLYTSFAAPT